MPISKSERYELKCDVCGKSGDFWAGGVDELLEDHRNKGWFIEFDVPYAVVCVNCVAVARKVEQLGLNALAKTAAV